MTSPNDSIAALRNQIDQLDREIVECLNQRAKLALEIGSQKKATGKAVFDPSREKAVIERALGLSSGPFPPKTLEFIFREVMAACRSLEEPTRVAYLGPIASFSHAAALRKFGSAATFLPQTDFADVFKEVERGTVAYGVVPVENSIEGAVTSTLDLFPESELHIVSEIYLEVSQNILSKEGDLSRITAVYSHPHGLAQCRTWLRKHLPNTPVHAVSSTSEAARIAAETPGAAAISSLEAAEIHGLQVLGRSIEDAPNNVTHFFVISREPVQSHTAPKTSLLITLKDEPGNLFQVLQPLAKARVNMSKIESRPLKRQSWEYRFFIDLEGDPHSEPLLSVISEMRKSCTQLRILGTYDKATRPSMASR